MRVEVEILKPYKREFPEDAPTDELIQIIGMNGEAKGEIAKIVSEVEGVLSSSAEPPRSNRLELEIDPDELESIRAILLEKGFKILGEVVEV